MLFYDQYRKITGPIAHLDPPDYGPLKTALANGLDINVFAQKDARDEQDTLLSNIIESYGDDNGNADNLPDIVRFFLDNGYNVNMNNGVHGALCLEGLCYSHYCDSSSLECAKMLLEAGADPNIILYDDEEISALDIAKEHDGDNRGLIDHDFSAANYYYTLAELFKYRNENKDYHKLYLTDQLVGKAVQKLYVAGSFREMRNHNNENKPQCFKRLFFVCDDMTVDIDDAFGIIVEKSAERLQRNDLKDCTELLGSQIDKKIKSVDYYYHKIHGYGYINKTECVITLENNDAIVIADDYVMGPYPTNWFTYLVLINSTL